MSDQSPESSPRGHILIVDDETNVRLTLVQAAEDFGFTADTATDGQEALQRLDATAYDLVLLDLRMPTLGGIDVLRQLHEQAMDVPVIVFTAHGSVDEVVEATRLGATDVLQKPISVKRLRAAIEDVFGDESVAGRADLADEWMELADWHVENRRWTAARTCLDKVLDVAPDRADAHVLMGVVEAEDGDRDAAQTHLERALELDPDSDAARTCLDRLDAGARLAPGRQNGERDEKGASETEGRWSIREVVRPAASETASTARDHRVLVMFDDHIEDRVTDPDRELLRLAWMSASAHAQSELLVLSVIEAPRNLALSQATEAHRERIERRQEQLDALVRDHGDEGLVGVRTMVVVAHDTPAVIQNAVDHEGIQHVVLGGGHTGDDAFRVSRERLPDDLPCEVTIVRPASHPPRTDEEHIVALVGESPHAPYVARRALEWAQGLGLATLTLLNVQETNGEVGETALRERGQRLLRDVAGRAGFRDEQYESRVLLADDADAVLVREVRGYDLVCVGATRNTTLAETVFGSVPNRITEHVDQSVGIVRGPGTGERSFLRALRHRLGV